MRNRIYSLVKKIPRGKVTTYGEISKEVGIHPRTVGKILSQNRDLKNIPCYRVVRSDGTVGGYVLGKRKKIDLLEKDGIEIKSGKVNLKKHLFKFKV
ncbi:MAG: MGMT family protein [Candidatus Aenigmarchaeota archaeon]|nr:MGMT family protein [Candidatus Aenigmarchaeota archaeon]